MAVLKFSVPKECHGKSVSQFLRGEFGVSGTTLKKAKKIPLGITMDGEHIRTVDPVYEGSVIAIVVDGAEREYRPLDISVPVLFEDDSFVVFDKPAGLPVHPSRGHPYDTLANVYAARKETAGLTYRPLGRLDRDTSGVVIVAKNAHIASNAKMVRKRYIALLTGYPEECDKLLDMPIGREGEDTQRRTVREDGQRAVTRYRILSSGGGYSLAELYLVTGRTHQIRVHMAYIGCPLAGDALYGGDCSVIQRQALHCAEVQFYHPMENSLITVRAPIPEDIKSAAAEILPDTEMQTTK